MRCCMSSKSLRPLSSRTTISPSKSARLAPMCRGKVANSGYWCVTSLPARERKRSLPSSTHANDRVPSHLISKSQPGSENGRSMSVASIGERALGIGASRAPSSSEGWIGMGLRLGGNSAAISSRVRPVRTELSCSSMFHAESMASSWCLIMSHSGCFSPLLVRTSTKLPESFSPLNLNLISPRSNCSCAPRFPSTRNLPRSQTITVPAP